MEHPSTIRIVVLTFKILEIAIYVFVFEKHENDTNIACRNMVLKMSSFPNIPEGTRDIPDSDPYFQNSICKLVFEKYEI